MSTIQQSQVKTLSDKAKQRSAQWADLAITGQTLEAEGHIDIDDATQSLRNAVKGVHSNSSATGQPCGTGRSLFDDLRTAGNSCNETDGTRKHSASKLKRRKETHSGIATRDRLSNGVSSPAGKGATHKSSPSANRSATPKAMTAELPFATCAIVDDARGQKPLRRPDAVPYRGMQMARRSSLPTPRAAFIEHKLPSPSKVGQKQRIARAIPTQTPSNPPTPTEWRTALNDSRDLHLERSLEAQLAQIENEVPLGPSQRLSQLLANPEVGGYLVMGALIACTFLV